MATRIIGDVARVLAYVKTRMPMASIENMKGVGLERDGELVAGVLYEGFNGRNVWMHVAATPGARWMTRDYLHFAFEYPFDQMGVEMVRGYVNAGNLAAVKFDEHLGFQKEAVLKGAASDGNDVFIYVMRRDGCKYLRG